MVTHLIPEALELADRIAVLSSRPGHVETVAKNNLPRPRKKRSADFFAMEDKLIELVKF
jgi:NitT/TauT family transport system ATP-binding protein